MCLARLNLAALNWVVTTMWGSDCPLVGSGSLCHCASVLYILSQGFAEESRVHGLFQTERLGSDLT